VVHDTKASLLTGNNNDRDAPHHRVKQLNGKQIVVL